MSLSFLYAGSLAVGNDFVGPGVRLVQDTRGLLPRFGNNLVRLGLCLHQLLLAAIRRRQPFLDLLLPLFERCQYRRPDVLHAEPDKHDHRDRLAQESHVDVHVMLLTALSFALSERALRPWGT